MIVTKNEIPLKIKQILLIILIILDFKQIWSCKVGNWEVGSCKVARRANKLLYLAATFANIRHVHLWTTTTIK